MRPVTPGEQLYNQSHIRTRNVIERFFGVLKRRFPVLAYGCRLKLSTSLTIIVATCILHNIAMSMGNINPPPLPDELDEHILNQLIENGQIPHINNIEGNENAAMGALFRRQFVHNYFSQL